MTDDETVFILPSPKAEFLAMPEKELLTALEKRESRKSKRIISEIGRLVEEYVINFKAYVTRNGTEPFLMEVTVRCAIEKMAIRVMLAALEAEKKTEGRTWLH